MSIKKKDWNQLTESKKWNVKNEGQELKNSMLQHSSHTGIGFQILSTDQFHFMGH